MASPHAHIRDQMIWIAAMDFLCLLVSAAAGVFIVFHDEEMGQYVFQHIDGWLILFASVLLANYLAGSYRLQYTFSRFNLVVTWFFSMAFAMLILSITSYAWFRFLLGRGVLFLSLASYSVLALFLKLVVYKALFRSHLFLCRVVIVGTGKRAAELRKMLEREWVLPAHKVVALVRMVGEEEREAERYSMDGGVAVVNCRASAFEALIRSLGANLIVIGPDDLDESRAYYPRLRRIRFEGTEVLTALATAEGYSGRTPLDLIIEEYVNAASMESGLPTVARLKRLMDVILSAVLFVALLPVAAVIALLIKATAPLSPVLYVQTRIGQFGRVFRIYKFRTMRVGAEQETGAVWAADNDPRVTPLGRILRRFRLDEIPQFLNIIKGDMSLVGPRPERPEIAAELERSIPFYGERENVMPGLTGWAQIRHPYGNTPEDAAKKLEFDLYYMKHMSFALDLQILLSTLQIVLLGMKREK